MPSPTPPIPNLESPPGSQHSSHCLLQVCLPTWAPWQALSALPSDCLSRPLLPHLNFLMNQPFKIVSLFFWLLHFLLPLSWLFLQAFAQLCFLESSPVFMATTVFITQGAHWTSVLSAPRLRLPVGLPYLLSLLTSPSTQLKSKRVPTSFLTQETSFPSSVSNAWT